MLDRKLAPVLPALKYKAKDVRDEPSQAVRDRFILIAEKIKENGDLRTKQG